MTRSIDVVVPVYNAPDDARRCIDSVLAHEHEDCRILVIDDASTDPGVSTLFADLEARRLSEVVLLRNEENVGFTRTANRGMEASTADIVLLNSDTIVTRGWLRRLRDCADSDARIGTITPFSTNAEICSFPRLCIDNPIDADDVEIVAAAIAAAAVPSYPDLPTGVGFCLFIRRAMIDEIGMFDPAFGAGYGEENDLCLRGARAGWRNVLADDAFVVHVGGRSFAGQKSDLSRRNIAILLDRHPHYTKMVEQYIAEDPLKAIRESAASELARMQSTAPGVLHVIHHHGGGTETHVRALIAASRERWRHYLVIAVGDRWQLEEHRRDGDVATFNFVRDADEEWPAFIGSICATFDIDLIHLHNISACREPLLTALPRVGVPYGYTVHDLNAACPTITFLGPDQMFCGAVTDVERCSACLAQQPEHAGIDIAQWRTRHRDLLAAAAFVIAPSQWAARTYERYFPRDDVRLIPHGAPTGIGMPTPLLSVPPLTLPEDGLATVAVLGAVGPDKGARRIERLVELARERNAPVRFVLIGYLDVQHGPWQSEDARFTVHGRYASEELPALLAHYRVKLILYPSAGPETFSYTLSEAWASGVPALVPPIGALAERVNDSGGGWIMSETQWRDERLMLDRLIELLDAPNRAAVDRVASDARQIQRTSLAQMADATFAVYAEALGRRTTLSWPPLSRARIRDALGYRAWKPPSIVVDSTDATPTRDVVTRVARAAFAIRHTAVGRTLYRVTPRPLRDALKARLKR